MNIDRTPSVAYINMNKTGNIWISQNQHKLKLLTGTELHGIEQIPISGISWHLQWESILITRTPK